MNEDEWPKSQIVTQNFALFLLSFVCPKVPWEKLVNFEITLEFGLLSLGAYWTCAIIWLAGREVFRQNVVPREAPKYLPIGVQF